MRVLDLRAQAVSVYRGDILALVKDCEGCICLVRINWPKLSLEHLHAFNGSRGLLLSRLRDMYLVSIDESLFVSNDLVEWRLCHVPLPSASDYSFVGADNRGLQENSTSFG